MQKGGGDSSGTAGIGRARARLTKAVRKHPKLASALPVPPIIGHAALSGLPASNERPPCSMAANDIANRGASRKETTDPGVAGAAALHVRAEWVRPSTLNPKP
jgi:hypothetical protein